MLLLLYRPQKAVGIFKASPWYKQSCYSLNAIAGKFDLLFMPRKNNRYKNWNSCLVRRQKDKR